MDTKTDSGSKDAVPPPKFESFQRRITEIRQKIVQRTKQSELDLVGYLELIQQRPTVEEAITFQKEAMQAGQGQQQYVKEAKDQLQFFEKVHASIWGYGQKKSKFRELVEKALKRDKDKDGFLALKEDWKSIRRLINEINLTSKTFMKSYALIEAIFRILKYFHESRDTTAYHKTAKLLNTLNCKFHLKQLAQQDPLLYRCLDFFLSLSEEDTREIMLGKRSPQPRGTPEALGISTTKKLLTQNHQVSLPFYFWKASPTVFLPTVIIYRVREF